MLGEVYMKNLEEQVWFVGANIEGEDQLQRFVDAGIWENGYEDKYTELVNSIKVGDRIAIKSTYTRKNSLPFDNKEKAVSVMAVKAIGVVTKNFNDGHKVSVQWELLSPFKEWYFFTLWNTIRQVTASDGWMQQNLIDFTFHNGNQNVDRFLNYPLWRDKYGDKAASKQYEWTRIYESLAKALLEYKDNRPALLQGIATMFQKIEMKNPLVKRKEDGTEEALVDVCPFTVFGLFNKGLTDKNRRIVLEGLATFLELEEDIPESSDGVPVLNNMKSWFFGDDAHRAKDDIENLWNLFESAIELAENYTDEKQNHFIELYDKVVNQHGIQWNITFGLYWIKPWDYVTLDGNTREALTAKLKVEVPCNSPKKTVSGAEYIALIQHLKELFADEKYPVHSFPELSYKAWKNELDLGPNIAPPISVIEKTVGKPYTEEDFFKEVFSVNENDYETIKSLIRRKKNIILQGVPGAGKTYAAKRIAYAMMGEKDESRVKILQFHQSYSYEDFIMGFRPNGNGFELKEGPFYQFCKKVEEDPDQEYFFIIDEINRGNMSKIFGELLMLIESDKRGEAVTLTYSNRSFSVPENLYIIGMMNTADRSLAIIDYALRRRFCFFELEPAFEAEGFKKRLLEQGASEELVDKIRNRIGKLNEEISAHANLGKDFRIGHSYFCEYEDSSQWYEEIVKYEIEPLINEYWFDEEDKAKIQVEELLR